MESVFLQVATRRALLLAQARLNFKVPGLRRVQLKDASRLIEIDYVAVNNHLVLASIWSNAMQIFNGMAAGTQFPNN